MKSVEIVQPKTEVSLSRTVRGLIIELRPREWTKNLLVFTGLIFSRSLSDAHNIWISFLGFVIFCCASSGVYLFNDLCDLKEDREHPVKRNRPLASGALSVNLARFVMVLLFAAAALGAIWLNHAFALIIGIYLATCLAYSFRLKDIVILDVILIAGGFVLRAISGAVIIGVDVSEWLVLCTSMVALLVGFGKRRHELVLLEEAAENHRRSLSDYSISFLDSIMNICAGAAVLTYALYTRADETIQRVGSRAMLLTIPFVVYGIFRYLFLIHKKEVGGDPVQLLFRDRPTLLNLVLWILTAVLVIYLPKLVHFLMNKIKLILILVFLVGAAVRFADVLHPIDRASWRECDLGAISRNYATESMNLFYPRIDWRGNTPGYAEMEFPLYPYLIAITYKIFGVQDYFGRIWAFVFSLLTLFFFFKLAREFLDDFSLIFACAFFAFNPLIVEFSTSIQPEGLMVLFYTASVFFCLKWLKTDRDKDFWFAAIATSLTILSKATAAHIGLFFGVLLLQKFGLQIFKQAKVWIFGAVALLPALLWYWHAKNLWKNYGNSLGVSNEYHWIGADFFTNSYFIKGILFSEFSVVWIFFGLAVGAFAVFQGFREKIVYYSLLWTASIFVLYLAAARTTADEWASYYHIFSILPAALLFGFGVGKAVEYFSTLFNFFGDFSLSDKLKKSVLFFGVAFAVCAVFALEARQIRANLLIHRTADESYVCAAKLKPAMPKEGLILVSGGHCFDADGYQTAYNASFMFYWLNRKGFNVCTEQQSIEKVKEFAGQGAKYFIAQKNIVSQKTDFIAELEDTFPLVSECSEFFVFDISKN